MEFHNNPLQQYTTYILSEDSSLLEGDTVFWANSLQCFKGS